MIINPHVSYPETAESWREFVKSGQCGRNRVRPLVEESWARCYAAGVDPFDGKSHDILDAERLNALLEEKRHLLSVARPLMQRLYSFVAGSGFVVMLTDERGYILETIGDPDTQNSAAELNFFPGARWTEEEVGTNAIGTGIVLKKPTQILAAEHYCEKHQKWTCSGAPIFNDAGEMIGFLDVSGPSELNHLHSLGMVVAAVEAIMDQMRLERNNRELTEVNERLSSILDNMSDGVFLTDNQGIIRELNPAAEEMLGKTAADLVGTPISEVLIDGGPAWEKVTGYQRVTDVELLADAVGGRHIHVVASSKPLHDEDGNVTGALIMMRSMEKVERLVNRFSGASAPFRFRDIVGRSQAIAEVIRIATMAARGSSSVLLEGESGTGKEMFAQAIHNRSSRARGPFVAVNCGALPRDLVASELFGYVEGAFTGARRGGRPGKFEMASGGTLFLDEIGDMPLEQQVALLRVLQQREVVRIGSDRVIPVDVRVICATNRDLRAEVLKGSFRQDLYYRLNVISIRIPPLRERREDIAVLFDYFLRKMGWQYGETEEYVEREVLYCLEQYDWPGNVRELQNVVERLVNIVDRPPIQIRHLPLELTGQHDQPYAPSPDTPISDRKDPRLEDLRRGKGEKEKERIIRTLERHGGNVTHAAAELGLSRNTLYRKLREYHIKD